MPDTFTTLTSEAETITSWQSKGMSKESNRHPTAPGNNLALKWKWILNSKTAVEFKESWLKQGILLGIK